MLRHQKGLVGHTKLSIRVGDFAVVVLSALDGSIILEYGNLALAGAENMLVSIFI